MKKSVLIICLAILLISCQTSTPEPTLQPTASPEPTSTPVPPTNTPIPITTITPIPISTPIPGQPFTGTWTGSDPIDNSEFTITLIQSESKLEGTFNDTFSPNVEPPGYNGQGTGSTNSNTTGQMTFQLSRWDGASLQSEFQLELTDDINTLILVIDTDPPAYLQRQ